MYPKEVGSFPVPLIINTDFAAFDEIFISCKIKRKNSTVFFLKEGGSSFFKCLVAPNSFPGAGSTLMKYIRNLTVL
jgi:hypothetical protein